MPTHIAITGGTKIIINSSLTNKVAVLNNKIYKKKLIL